MLDFSIDIIPVFVTFKERVYQQTIGISMRNNYAPFLVNIIHLFIWTDVIREILRKNEMKHTLSFNFTFRCIDDVTSLNNSKF